jgi:hypothetical protein
VRDVLFRWVHWFPWRSDPRLLLSVQGGVYGLNLFGSSCIIWIEVFILVDQFAISLCFVGSVRSPARNTEEQSRSIGFCELCYDDTREFLGAMD